MVVVVVVGVVGGGKCSYVPGIYGLTDRQHFGIISINRSLFGNVLTKKHHCNRIMPDAHYKTI